MVWRTILFIWFICWLNNCVIFAQNPIGLCASASLRGLLLGTAVLVNNIEKNVDNGNYTSNLKKNYQLVIPEMGMKPQQIWSSENVYGRYTKFYWLGSTKWNASIRTYYNLGW
jgi:hypothetical protein